MHIRIRRGLNIPIKGAATGPVKAGPTTAHIALDLATHGPIRWKLLAKEGDPIALGQPLVFDKQCEERVINAPAGGRIAEVRKGEKMRLLTIVIEKGEEEPIFERPPISPSSITLSELASRGLLAHIRARPFGTIAHPHKSPRAIFVQAVESAPFIPPAQFQVEGHEQSFQAGLEALSKLTKGDLHLVCQKGSFENVPFAIRHTISGPHPIASPSLHIQKIGPIRGVEDVVWTLTAFDVVAIGEMLIRGRPHTDRVIAVAGTGFRETDRGFFRVRSGASLTPFTSLPNASLISGGPLSGRLANSTDFLGWDHFACTALQADKRRPPLYFLRPGFGRYSAHRVYPPTGAKGFSDRLHGEARPFVDGHIYDRVMPLSIPTMPLIKAVMAEDWEKAEAYGFLEIVPEDFALPAFVCPSKVEMPHVMEMGIASYLTELTE